VFNQALRHEDMGVVEIRPPEIYVLGLDIFEWSTARFIQYNDFCLSCKSNAHLLVLEPVAVLTYEIYISNFCENTFRKMTTCRTERQIIHVKLYNANKLRGFEEKGTSSRL
jgi:hypothetical protein